MIWREGGGSKERMEREGGTQRGRTQRQGGHRKREDTERGRAQREGGHREREERRGELRRKRERERREEVHDACAPTPTNTHGTHTLFKLGSFGREVLLLYSIYRYGIFVGFLSSCITISS